MLNTMKNREAKYFFAMEVNGNRHIIVAEDIAEANDVMESAGLKKEVLYELLPNTFSVSGFLISDK